MALLTQDGRYIKVIGPTPDGQQVRIITFASREQRDRWPNLTRFERCIEETVYVGPNLLEELAKPVDAGKNVKDNAITACYLALKRDSRFSETTDV